jgi:hypothetical protein
VLIYDPDWNPSTDSQVGCGYCLGLGFTCDGTCSRQSLPLLYPGVYMGVLVTPAAAASASVFCVAWAAGS